MSQILGPDGRPIEITRGPDEPQTARVGWLQREFDEHPARGLTPAKLHSIMVAAEQGDIVRQLELTDDMEERDAHIYAELGKRRGALTALAWSVEAPENADAAEKKLADQVTEWLGELTAEANGVVGGMELVLSTMTDAILKGFAPQEMVWSLVPDGSGRKVQLPQLKAQPQRWFTLSADRRSYLLRSREMTEATADLPAVMGEPLQPLAWLNHVHPARNGYLARMSLARVLFWPYLFKNYSIRDLAEFLEIYGLPLRIGKYPTGASDEEKRRLLQAVVQVGHNAAGIIPQSMALEFEAAAAGTEVPFLAMWRGMDAAESKAILGQTLTASEGEHGTQALGNVHNDVRMDIRNADARMIEGTVNRQLIAPMCQLNVAGVNPRRLPKLKLDTGEPEDLAMYATSLPPLAKLGMQIPVDWAHEKLRIPKPKDGEAVLAEPPPPAPVAAPGVPAAAPGAPRPAPGPTPPAPKPAPKPPAAKAALTGQVDNGPPADLIDELVAEQVDQWQPLLGPLIEPLMAELDKAVAAGEDLTTFAVRLPQLVARLDVQALATDLARSAFSARLAGEADLDLERP